MEVCKKAVSKELILGKLSLNSNPSFPTQSGSFHDLHLSMSGIHAISAKRAVSVTPDMLQEIRWYLRRVNITKKGAMTLEVRY